MGVFGDQMMLSARTNDRDGAGGLVQEIVGDMGSAGGHGTMSAGQIPLRGQNPAALSHQLKQRALERLAVGPDTSGEKLI
jgi:nanoRNase/pAp phosphatase (c-di-AMP/oligoRNAs hydrolase)